VDKQTVISRLAHICYRPKTEDDDDYAVQLLMESLVLPDSKPDYTVEDMKTYIEIFFRDMKVEFSDDSETGEDL
jgi:hypothetical protein